MAEKKCLSSEDVIQLAHGSETVALSGLTVEQFECAVCLQACMHPVRLPCDHIFCFLCVKGVAIQSKRCALCRKEIPVDYFNNPVLVKEEDLLKDSSFEDGNWWFYEGRNGWWQYDERTSLEIEERYKQGLKSFELLIAGFLYILDLENMVQYRRNDPFRRRRVKRDLISIPKKGVAGLKIMSPVPQRSSGDGGERGGVKTALAPPKVTAASVDANANGQTTDGTTLVPPPPHNTPHGTVGASPASRTSPQPDLVTQMAQISLNPRQQNTNHSNQSESGLPRPQQYPNNGEDTDSSDDGDWS